jgi:hypothetical protein
MEKVVGPTEANRYLTADGGLSQAGIMRIRNALFALAFGDSASLGKLAESPDDNARNITGAMAMVAARLASINKEIAKGQNHSTDCPCSLRLCKISAAWPISWVMFRSNTVNWVLKRMEKMETRKQAKKEGQDQRGQVLPFPKKK